MIKIALLSISGALLPFGISSAPAAALANRTFVSGKGTDTGTCALAAPFQTFAFALTQTVAGGEIDVLDPAGYGAMAIAKAISIVNDGVGDAAIGASSGIAVTINAGVGDSVYLRGLTIAGLGSKSTGIVFNAGLNLTPGRACGHGEWYWSRHGRRHNICYADNGIDGNISDNTGVLTKFAMQ